MKPLNHKERSDKFFNFVVAGTITVAITIFCFYYTNYFLVEAIAGKKIEQYSRFQQYKRNQQQYIKQLEEINKSLSGGLGASILTTRAIDDFRANFKKNGDGSDFMNKIVDLADKDAALIDQKNQAIALLNSIKRDWKDCNTKLTSDNKRPNP